MGDPVAAALDGGVDGLRAAYGEGLHPVEVVREVLDRIAGSDDPAVWIDVEARADLEAAAAALDPAQAGAQALWGVPFGVKDNIDVAGRVTTGALPGLARRAERTATVAQRLLDAGGLYVGKTNLDQLATGLVGTRSPYGTPRNPFDAELVPGGSSSGSAVAVALGHVPIAMATDTAGSGRVPAAMCGVVGAKDPPGRQPLDGVLPASPSVDCVSTFATRVGDALLVEGLTAGRPWPVGRGPWRVAVAPGTDLGELADLAALGHEVVEADLAPFHEAGDLLYGGPLLADRAAALADVLAADPEGLLEVIRTILAGASRYAATDLAGALQRLQVLRKELATWWEGVDALVLPTVPFLPTLAAVAADPIGVNLALGRNVTFANLLGLGAVAVPAAHGPGGVTVLGPPGHLGAVAALAGELHGERLVPGTAATGARVLLSVVGAHLRGQPLNGLLVDRGAELVATTTTAPRYRLHRLAGGAVARPALERVERGGAAIEVEVWSLDPAGFGAVVAEVPAPLGIGSLELADGSWTKGFVCELGGLAGAEDITAHGGWRAYLAAAG